MSNARPWVPSGLPERIGAAIIDFLLVGTTLHFAAIVVDEVFDAALRGWFLTLAAGVFGYPALAHWMHGRTVGKAVAGIIVEDLHGKPLSLWRSAVRSLASGAPPILLIVGGTLGVLEATAGNTAQEEGWGGFITGLIRFAIGFSVGIALALVYQALALTTVILRNDRRAIHDLIAGTRVRMNGPQ